MRSVLHSLALSGLLALSAAHPDIDDPVAYKREQLALRHELQKRCAPQVAAHREARMAKRAALEDRQGITKRSSESERDATCLMTPETTQGPYHILGELVRQDITEGQEGVPLDLDISFIDVNTCAPLQVWVDVWSCNATGFYSGYTTSSIIGPAPGSGGNATGVPAGGPTNSLGLNPNAAPTNLTGLPPWAGADPANATLPSATDELSFLRGVWKSDAAGQFAMKTIYPGWYTGRAIHIHFKVYEQGSVADNGTFIAGTAHHTGQWFFDDDLTAQVAQLAPYTDNPVAYVNMTTNEEDGIWPYETIDDYNPNMDIMQKGSNISDGLIGHVLVAINTSYISPEDASSRNNVTGSPNPTGLPLRP